MRPQRKGKIIAGFLSATGAALLTLGLLPAGTVAAPNPGPESDGPQSANIPYVAWVGEHVRLVACDPLIATRNEDGQFASYQLEDWSGRPEAAELPAPDPSSSSFFAPSAGSSQAEIGAGCAKIDFKSLNPGLARIRAVITNEATGAIVFSHQFLVIWLTTNKPTLSEVGTESNVPSGDATFQNQLSSTGHANLSSFIGDPSGDGEFAPSPFDPETATNQDKGLIQIKVTGSFPVQEGSSLHNILPNPSYTLPESWETLAKALATSSEEREPQGSNPGLWDIHGTASEASTQNGAEPTGDPLKADFFRPAFSNDTSGETATAGPFDPQAADQTLLSDTKLNADDAPMPSLRVDVSIAKNEGSSSLTGAGQISGASKAMIYSHDFTGNAKAEGNLYNPYYGAYIPSTDRPVPEASGIDGPSPGGDFPAFLNKHPEPYSFWTSVASSGERTSVSTGCLRRNDNGEEPSDYQTPGGPSTETFYTDERGEAYVTYTPGDQFYLNHLPVLQKVGEEENGKIVKNADGGCDLRNLYKEVIGESSILATAVYPYQAVDYSQQTSETPVLKKIRSLWEKEFFEFPKGPGPDEQNVRIVVAKAQDIDGYPIVGETVCFHAQQEAGIYSFSEELEDPQGLLHKGTNVDLSGSSVRDPADEGSNHLCKTTNSLGLAGVELADSTSSSVDLTARYEDEGIIRDHLVDFSTNIGTREAEKQQRAEAERLAAEKKEAEKKQGEREVAAERRQLEREEAAEKRQHEKEEAKEVAEKKSTAEIEANRKVREAEEAATKKRNEESLAKHKEEVEKLAKLVGAKSLVTQLPGALGDRHKAHGKNARGKGGRAAKHRRKTTRRIRNKE